MKKVFLVLLVLISLFSFTSCVDKVTDDESAMDAFLMASAKFIKKDGFAGNCNMGINMIIPENIPVSMVLDYDMEVTINPVISGKMDMNLSVNVYGMEVSIPMEAYCSLEDGEGMYVKEMNSWEYIPFSVGGNELFDNYKKFLENLRTKESLTKLESVFRNGSFAKYNGETQINDIPVYDIDIVFTKDFFPEFFNMLMTYDFIDNFEFTPEEMGESFLEELSMMGEIFEGITLKVYLRTKDCSLYGQKLDIGLFVENIKEGIKGLVDFSEKEIREIEETMQYLNINGYIEMFYSAKEPKKPIVVPEEVIETAKTVDISKENDLLL